MSPHALLAIRHGLIRLLSCVPVNGFVGGCAGFAEKYGEQFTPAPLLVDYAKANKKFRS
jgi:hypothetical protein